MANRLRCLFSITCTRCEPLTLIIGFGTSGWTTETICRLLLIQEAVKDKIHDLEIEAAVKAGAYSHINCSTKSEMATYARADALKPSSAGLLRRSRIASPSNAP